MIPPPSSPSSSEEYSSPSSSEEYSSHRIPWTLIIQVGGLALAIVVIFLLSSQYPVLNWIGDARKHIESLGLWSGIVYPIAYAVCNVLLLPGGILSIGGGFLFGLWWGFLIVLVGNLLGAAAAFCIARWLGRRRIEKLIHNSRRLGLIDRAIERHGWKIVVLSQLNPLAPSSLLNYLYGLTRVPLHRCLMWVALGQIPGLFLYSFIGTLGQFGVEMARGTKQPGLHDYSVWGSGFILTICTTYLLGRLAKRILAEVEGEMESQT